MAIWVELGIAVLIVEGGVQGYLGGLKKTAALVLLLLLIFLMALAFGQAGADYLVLHHQADVRIMPVLLQRLPLVITVTPPQAPLPATSQRAAALVEQMPLAPVYRDWLVSLSPFARTEGLSEHVLVARVFALLLLRKGAFLFFFGILILSRVIAGQVLTAREQLWGGVLPRLAAALLGAGCTLFLLAVVLTALAPFSPLFLGILAFDLADSRLAQALMALGLNLMPGL